MTDATQLEDGFYWVRDGNVWVVMEFYDGRWWRCASQSYAPDEIDPRPIKRESQ